jgi:hypothetical protein
MYYHEENPDYDCYHELEPDMIDIDPDRSMMIYRCIHCDYMVNKLPSPPPVCKETVVSIPIKPQNDKIEIDYSYSSNSLLSNISQKTKSWKDTIYDFIRGATRRLLRKKIPENDMVDISLIPQRQTSCSPDIDTGSCYSSISIDGFSGPSRKSSPGILSTDVQSIHVEQDIENLSSVSIDETIPFTPNIQYGKVLEVRSPRDIVIASRIYNGYTKVLKPKLYRFHVTLSNIPYYGIHDENAKQILTKILLNQIVVIQNTYTHPESNIIFAEVFHNGMDVNNFLLNLFDAPRQSPTTGTGV